MRVPLNTVSVPILAATIRRQFGITFFGKFLHLNLAVIDWGIHTLGAFLESIANVFFQLQYRFLSAAL